MSISLIMPKHIVAGTAGESRVGSVGSGSSSEFFLIAWRWSYSEATLAKKYPEGHALLFDIFGGDQERASFSLNAG